MTGAQVAKIAALTGDWTEPLPREAGGRYLTDDGRLYRPDADGPLVPMDVLLVLKGGAADLPRVPERFILIGRPLTRETF